MSPNPAAAFYVGDAGLNDIEIYGRIVDSVDNFLFAFSTSTEFVVEFIFGGYTLDGGGFISDSGFVSEGNAEKTATFSLLDADNMFAVVDTEDYTTDVTSGDATIFSGAAGNWVLQIDGSGAHAPGAGVGLYDIRISEVPVPASALLLMAGLGGLGAMRRRKG